MVPTEDGWGFEEFPGGLKIVCSYKLLAAGANWAIFIEFSVKLF